MPDRPKRADARRNYDLVVVAAKEVFAELGVTAPLDEVARRAGVGNATMYRHFPDRRDLIIAVYADEVTALCGLGESLLTADAPADALFTWLHAFAAHVAGKRELPMAISEDPSGQRSTLYQHWHNAMSSTGEALLTRAQEARTVHSELSTADILTLISGIATASSSQEQSDRLIAIVRRACTT